MLHISDENVFCNQSVSKFSKPGINLKKNKMSVNEGVKYLCNLCDYKASRQGHLKTHKSSVHMGVKYSCNQCDYRASQQGHL